PRARRRADRLQLTHSRGEGGTQGALALCRVGPRPAVLGRAPRVGQGSGSPSSPRSDSTAAESHQARSVVACPGQTPRRCSDMTKSDAFDIQGLALRRLYVAGAVAVVEIG